MPKITENDESNLYNILKHKRELVQTQFNLLMNELVKISSHAATSGSGFFSLSSSAPALNFKSIVGQLTIHNNNYQQTPVLIDDFINYVSELSQSNIIKDKTPELHKQLIDLNALLEKELSCMKQRSIDKVAKSNEKLNKVAFVLGGVSIFSLFGAVITEPQDDDEHSAKNADVSAAFMITAVASISAFALTQIFRKSTNGKMPYDYIVTGSPADIESQSSTLAHNPILGRSGYQMLQTTEASAPLFDRDVFEAEHTVVEAVAIGTKR